MILYTLFWPVNNAHHFVLNCVISSYYFITDYTLSLRNFIRNFTFSILYTRVTKSTELCIRS